MFIFLPANFRLMKTNDKQKHLFAKSLKND